MDRAGAGQPVPEGDPRAAAPSTLAAWGMGLWLLAMLIGGTLLFAVARRGWALQPVGPDAPSAATADMAISVLRPGVRSLAWWTLVLAWIVLPAAIARRSGGWGRVALATLVLLVATLTVSGLTRSRRDAFFTADHLSTVDGDVWVVFDVSRMSDRDWALGRVVDRGWLTWRVQLVARSEGGNAGSCLRPDGYDLDVGDGLRLVAEPHGGVALLRCDVYWGIVCFARVSEAGGMERGVVSPFLLFEANDVGRDAELKAWCESVRTARHRPPTPRDPHLLAALDHPSPWVREAAAALARSGKARWFKQTLAALPQRE